MRVFVIVPLIPAIVLEAMRGSWDHSFSYFEAQICAASNLEQIPIMITEDFPVGATTNGVTFANPMAEDFDLG